MIWHVGRSAENSTEKFLSKSTVKCDLSFLKPKPEPKQLVNSLKDEPWRFWKTQIRQKKNIPSNNLGKITKKTTSFRCIQTQSQINIQKKSTWQTKHHSGSITLVSSIRAYHQAAMRPDPRVPHGVASKGLGAPKRSSNSKFLRKNSPQNSQNLKDD